MAFIAVAESTASDQFDRPELTVRLTPTQAHVQQQIVQTVRLISSHPFEALDLDLPPVPGADEITLIKRRVSRSKTYGFDGYVYETARALFPRTSGSLTVPRVTIRGAVALSADEEAEFVRQTRDTLVTVSARPPTHSAPYWLVANAVEISDEWSAPVDSLRIGDSVRRTIHVLVNGVTGEHLPDLVHRAGHLITLAAGSKRRTEITRDGVIGHLTQSFDIAFTTENPVDLAPVVIDWWDAGTSQSRRTILAAKRIEPLPRDVNALVAEQMRNAEQRRDASRQIRLGLIAVLVMMLVGVIIGFLVRRDRAYVRAITRHNDPAEVTRALYAWQPGRALPGKALMPAFAALIGRLGESGRQSVTAIQRQTFGADDGGPVEYRVRRTLAAALTRIAREQRRLFWRNRLETSVNAILGPIRRLPSLDE